MFMMLKAYEALVSINLVEEHLDDELGEEIGHFFWRWTYPTIDNDIRFFIEKRLITPLICHEFEIGNFSFYKIRDKWIYILKNPKRRFNFILLTKDFYPYHYNTLLLLFADLYQNGNTLAKLLHYYLMLMITDRIVIETNNNNNNHHNNELSFYNDNKYNTKISSTIQLCSIIKLFSLDVILIYTALLLKKKIVVYHHDPQILFDFVITLPDFIPHRIGTRHTILVPNIDLQSSEQINDLKARNHFISTFNDPRIEEHEDLYDVYINLAAVEITISHKAKDVFMMTKTHKDVAISLVREVEKENTTDANVINQVIKKTNELLNVLYSMNEEQNPITKEKLKEKLSSPNLEHFFWNLAIAEGLATND